ncbi:MAG: hypothetical protein LBT59_30770 [Clostridiales bacterium]|nr:hypothetical protein [Clostridiales bacterium]
MAKAGGWGRDLLTVVFNSLNKTLVIERGSQAAMKAGGDSVRLHLAAWVGTGDPAGIAALKSHGAGATVKIARARRKVLKKSLDPAALAIMKGIKAVFDPGNILNPDKII